MCFFIELPPCFFLFGHFPVILWFSGKIIADYSMLLLYNNFYWHINPKINEQMK